MLVKRASTVPVSPRPRSIRWFAHLYLNGVVALTLNLLLHHGPLGEIAAVGGMSPYSPAIGAVLVAASGGVLWFFIAWQASNVARWLATGFVAINFLNVPGILAVTRMLALPYGVMMAVAAFLSFAGIGMLYRRDAAEWFARGGRPDRIDPPPGRCWAPRKAGFTRVKHAGPEVHVAPAEHRRLPHAGIEHGGEGRSAFAWTAGGAPGQAGEYLVTDTACVSMRDSLTVLALVANPAASPQLARTGETSLENMTRDLLEPTLSEWIDNNLPSLVESMVASEISRIVGRAA